MEALEAIRLLESLQKKEEIEAFKYQQILYHSSLPLYANGGDIPEAPELPEWFLNYLEDRE